MEWKSPYIDPLFYEIEKLFDEMHRKLRELQEPVAKELEGMLDAAQKKVNSLGVEIHDEKDRYIILYELPGFKKEDINIDATPQYIEIRAHRKPMELEGYTVEEKYIERRIKLPEEIEPRKVRATFNNGILEIIAPKKYHQEKVKVPIE